MGAIENFSWDTEGFEYIQKVESENQNNDQDKSNDDDLSMQSLFSNEEETDESNVIENNDEESNDDESNSDDEEESEDSEEVNENEESSNVNYTSIAKELQEFGLFEDGEDIGEIDSNTFIEKIDQSVESRVNESIEDFMNKLGDDGKALVNFIKSGGSVDNFIKLYSNNANMPVESVDTEENQEAFLRYYYGSVEGMTLEEVDESIEALKDIDKLERNARNAFNIYNRKIESERSAVLQRQQEAFEEAKKQGEIFKDNVIKTVSESDNIANIKLSNNDKKSLISYITRASVKTNDGYISQLQNDMSKALQDPNKLIIIAKLLQDDFDFSKIEKGVTSKVTQKVKKKLNRIDILDRYF